MSEVRAELGTGPDNFSDRIYDLVRIYAPLGWRSQALSDHTRLDDIDFDSVGLVELLVACESESLLRCPRISDSTTE